MCASCISLAVSIVKNLGDLNTAHIHACSFLNDDVVCMPTHTISESCHYITQKNTGKMIVGGHRQTCHRLFEFLTGAKCERSSRDVFSPDRIKRAYSAATHCDIGWKILRRITVEIF